MNWLQIMFLAMVRLYRALISPVLTCVSAPMGFGCRFTPTCSEYAIQAIAEHGAIRGTLLSIRRLCRCHPWGGCGCDPVPSQKFRVPGSEFRVVAADDPAMNSPAPEFEAARHS